MIFSQNYAEGSVLFNVWQLFQLQLQFQFFKTVSKVTVNNNNITVTDWLMLLLTRQLSRLAYGIRGAVCPLTWK